MKYSRLPVLPAIALLSATVANTQGSVVAIYDSMVAPTAGSGGAADPTTQGFTFVGSTNQFASGYDSGDGGWRTVDGTGGAPAYYQQPLSATQVSDITTSPSGWTLSWISAVDEDALGDAGGFVNDYYLSPNNGRQNNNAIWFEVAGNYRYIITHGLDASNNITFSDGTSTISTGISATAFPQLSAFSLAFDGTNATLDWGSGSALVATSGVAGSDRLIFGSFSSGGQGSVVYNRVSLVVPEPSRSILLMLGCSVALICRRRPRR